MKTASFFHCQDRLAGAVKRRSVPCLAARWRNLREMSQPICSTLALLIALALSPPAQAAETTPRDAKDAPAASDLVTYLNDHLAGSVAALEMLDHMIEMHEGKPLQSFLKDLKRDIESDQNELKELMKRLDFDESAVRKTGAWVMEKLARAKLQIGASGEANVGLLQSLEGLALGITGKRSLWRVLAAAGKNVRPLEGMNLARLEARATDQIERVEAAILEIARAILRPETDTSDE